MKSISKIAIKYVSFVVLVVIAIIKKIKDRNKPKRIKIHRCTKCPARLTCKHSPFCEL
jgi:hypothetical protein